MDRNKAIVKRLINFFRPPTIARKNWYDDKSHNTFKGWAKRNGAATIEDSVIAKKSEKYLKNPIAFIIACQFNMGKPLWKAWRTPYLLSEKLGRLTLNKLLNVNLKNLEKAIAESKLACRNLSAKKAARNLKKMCQIIESKYNSSLKNIWEKAKDIPDLQERLKNLPGFGLGLTDMTTKIMLKLGMINHIKKDKKSKSNLFPKADIHVKRVFYRTGLIDEENEASVRVAAEELFPEFPMALDSATFYIGRQFCHATKPNCQECPLFELTNGKKLCRTRINKKHI